MKKIKIIKEQLMKEILIKKVLIIAYDLTDISNNIWR